MVVTIADACAAGRAALESSQGLAQWRFCRNRRNHYAVFAEDAQLRVRAIIHFSVHHVALEREGRVRKEVIRLTRACIGQWDHILECDCLWAKARRWHYVAGESSTSLTKIVAGGRIIYRREPIKVSRTQNSRWH